MTTITTSTPHAMSPEALTAAIRQEHAAVNVAAQTALQHALEAGRLLADARHNIPHGSWESYVKDSCGIAPRTASLYLRLHRNRDRLPNRQHVADLSVRQAARLLERPRAKAEPVAAAAEQLAVAGPIVDEQAAGELQPAADDEAGLDRHPQLMSLLAVKAEAEVPLAVLRQMAAEMPEAMANDRQSLRDWIAGEFERLAELHRKMRRWYSTPAWYRPDSLIVAAHGPTKSWVEIWPHPERANRLHVILHVHEGDKWIHTELPSSHGLRRDELQAFLEQGETIGLPWNDQASWAITYEAMPAERVAELRPYLCRKKRRRRAARQGASA